MTEASLTTDWEAKNQFKQKLFYKKSLLNKKMRKLVDN
ncbi:MAG: hypothetical protein JWR38_1732 [Mucilaginibacter sp.]|nr:hypothetical protein [Mucilaginibacter sp.]